MAESCNDSETILDRLGGEDMLLEMVNRFYQLASADPDLKPFFARANMDSLLAHQRRFMSLMFTSSIPKDFDVVGFLVDRHYKLIFKNGLKERHFDSFLNHFVTAIMEADVDPEVVDEIVNLLIPCRETFELKVRQEMLHAGRNWRLVKEYENIRQSDQSSSNHRQSETTSIVMLHPQNHAAELLEEFRSEIAMEQVEKEKQAPPRSLFQRALATKAFSWIRQGVSLQMERYRRDVWRT